ncbi:SDR family oxidoreductase [Thalassolituus maritimus]|jgi:short-subunit dehydrogenase|uniref:SDR family NAD(P)-dependent oxidoreductase n=1 Tax=Thalassolituus maritimus TaxID=484498 RepID=A0ABP9ZWJ9_9GAMM|nr:SDR family oxidoreductase [Pseudomonadota bacterium]MEC8103902.1 SDR family oxidoreductase [Pseudomonadota bacterium]
MNNNKLHALFNDKLIWITGASSGIGEQLCYDLSKLGARLILSARRSDELERVKNACAQPDKHLILPLDMLQEADIIAAADKVNSQFGAVDYLFNNAGITQRSLINETETDIYRKVMELNYFAQVTLTRQVLPGMLARGEGHIVTTSSIAGLIGIPYRSAYCSSKHAIIGFMDSLRSEVHDKGLRVTTLCPGFVRTNIIETARREGTAQEKVEDTVIKNGMSVEAAIAQVLDAVANEKEQVVIAEGKEGMGPIIKRFFPSIIYKMVRKMALT